MEDRDIDGSAMCLIMAFCEFECESPGSGHVDDNRLLRYPGAASMPPL
jgi:hypothetical protein